MPFATVIAVCSFRSNTHSYSSFMRFSALSRISSVDANTNEPSIRFAITNGECSILATCSLPAALSSSHAIAASPSIISNPCSPFCSSVAGITDVSTSGSHPVTCLRTMLWFQITPLCTNAMLRSGDITGWLLRMSLIVPCVAILVCNITFCARLGIPNVLSFEPGTSFLKMPDSVPLDQAKPDAWLPRVSSSASIA